MRISKLSHEEMVQRLREDLESKAFIDVGKQAEEQYEVTRTRLLMAIDYLRKNENYVIHYIRATQHGSGKPTTVKVLTGPGVTYKEAVLRVFHVSAQ